jgi:hypothetical protein
MADGFVVPLRSGNADGGRAFVNRDYDAIRASVECSGPAELTSHAPGNQPRSTCGGGDLRDAPLCPDDSAPLPLFALAGILIRALSGQSRCNRQIASRVSFARWPSWCVAHAVDLATSRSCVTSSRLISTVANAA